MIPAVTQVVGVTAKDQRSGAVTGLEGGHVLDEDGVLAGRQHDIWKIEVEAAAQPELIHAQRGGADILHLEVFKVILVVGIAGRRFCGMVHNLGNAQRRQRGEVGGGHRPGPEAIERRVANQSGVSDIGVVGVVTPRE